MRILVTNDDGYESRGVRALRVALIEAGHEVWMLAPHRNMSACSHSITTKHPLRMRKLDEERCFSCAGTPTDCVILALRGVLNAKFDCVVSGINIGPNLGDDITFSGTVAAARQSVLMGVPAIATSLVEHDPEALQFLPGIAAQISARLGELLALCDSAHLVSVNVPNKNRRMRWVLAYPARRMYDDHFVRFSPPNSKDNFFFMSAVPQKITPEPGSDVHTVHGGDIAVSVVGVHPVMRDMSDYRGALDDKAAGLDDKAAGLDNGAAGLDKT